MFSQTELRDHDVVTAIIKKDNRYLVLWHNKYDFWAFPTSKVDPGESPLQALSREMREEIGIQVTNSIWIKEVDKKDKRDQVVVNIRYHLFEILAYEGEISNREPSKHREIRWLSQQDLSDQSLSFGAKAYFKGLDSRKV